MNPFRPAVRWSDVPNTVPNEATAEWRALETMVTGVVGTTCMVRWLRDGEPAYLPGDSSNQRPATQEDRNERPEH